MSPRNSIHFNQNSITSPTITTRMSVHRNGTRV